MALLKLLSRQLMKEHKKHIVTQRNLGQPLHGGQNKNTYCLLAEKIGVSRLSVKNWFTSPHRHPSNKNTKKILELAFEYDDGSVVPLLEEDLWSHDYALGIMKNYADNLAYPKLGVNGGVYSKKQELIA